MFAGHCIRQSKRRERASNCWSLRLCSCGQVLFVKVSCKGCYQWKKYSGCLQKISNGKSIFNFLLLTEALKGRFVFILLIKINQKLRVGIISSPSGSCKTKKTKKKMPPDSRTRIRYQFTITPILSHIIATVHLTNL